MKHDRIVKKGQLRSIEKRIELLHRLRISIINHNDQILDALKSDLRKPSFEAYIAEIDFVLHELKLAVKGIRSWARDKIVSTPLSFAPAKSFIRSEPFGKVLIIGPWNFPFMLTFVPLVGALAAGNTVLLKPSEVAEKTAAVIAKIIEEAFPDGEVSVVTGGVQETTELLSHKFDYIFYTGSGLVGKIVMAAAAKHLTPLTLELGGKSPCLIYSDNLGICAKRVMWGKFLNAGQACVAPDYVLIAESKKDEFVKHCQKWLTSFYGKDAKSSSDYGRIINERHFDRVYSYLAGLNVLVGGHVDKPTKYISPTLVEAKAEDPIMMEEVFGPVLPILSINSVDEAIEFINKRDKPLACYGFLDSEIDKKKLIDRVSAGGMVINDTLIHLSNTNLPFGGVGKSGFGSYHGKYSFDTFSHKKSVMKRSFLIDSSLRYPPYEGKIDTVRKLMKFLQCLKS